MRVELGKGYAKLIREDGDKAISHESTVGYKMKKLLNAEGHHFVRINPSKYGLNSCKLGLRDHKAGISLWHERYAVEAAHQAFNQDKYVTFQRVDDDKLHVFNPDHNLFCQDCGCGELQGEHGMIPGDGGASGKDFSPMYKNQAIRKMYDAALGLSEFESDRPDYKFREYLKESE